MDIRALGVAFISIFLAEIGDKTQLLIPGLTMESRHPFMVFIGAGLALLTTTAIAVFAGRLLKGMIPLQYFRIVGGIVFILFGIFMLTGRGT